MTELKLYNYLKENYLSSTLLNNHFEKAVNSISWDNIYSADGEQYHCLGCFSLITENINPFDQVNAPTIIFSDGSIVNF